MSICNLSTLETLLEDKESFQEFYDPKHNKLMANNFLFLYKTLSYSNIVHFLLYKGIDYSINDFELIEISISKKQYSTIDVFINYYSHSLNRLFAWGFERENPIIMDYSIKTKDIHIDNNYKRMSRYFLINKMDKKTISIFTKHSGFSKYYLEKNYKSLKHNYYYKKNIKIKKRLS